MKEAIKAGKKFEDCNNMETIMEGNNEHSLRSSIKSFNMGFD